MATRQAKSLAAAVTTTGWVTAATVPTATKWEITEAIFGNDTGTTRNCYVAVLRGATRYLIAASSVPTATTTRHERFTTLVAGDQIQVTAAAANLTVLVSGIEVEPV